MKVNVNFKCFSIVVFKLLRIMMKLFLNRFRRDHGAIVGRLSQEVVNRQGIVVGHQYICDTKMCIRDSLFPFAETNQGENLRC